MLKRVLKMQSVSENKSTFIHSYSYLALPCTENQPIYTGETLLFSPTTSFMSVLAGVRLSVLLGLLARARAIWINFFFPSLKPIPSSSEHIDLQSCTYSSYSSWCFCLQASPSHYFYIGHSVLTADANHASYKCISKALSLWCFTHRKITLNLSFVPVVWIHLADLVWLLVKNFKSFYRSTYIFNTSPYSLFTLYTSEKRRVSCNEHREQLFHTEKKGSILIMTSSHTTFGYDHLRSSIWEGPSWLHFLNRGPCGRANRGSEALLVILFVAWLWQFCDSDFLKIMYAHWIPSRKFHKIVTSLLWSV